MKRIVIPRVLRKNFCTYLIILLIPLISLTSFFYYYLLHQFQATIYSVEQKSCENTVVRVENALNQLQDMAIQLGNNRDLLLNNLDRSVLSQIRVIEMMRYSLSLNTLVDDMLLVGVNGMIYSSAGSFQVQSYSSSYNVPLGQIILEAQKKASLGGLQFVYQDSTSLYFSCNYPYSSPYPAGVMVFRVNANRLASDITHSTYVVSFNDVVMVSDNEEYLAATQKAQYKHFEARFGAVSIDTYLNEKTIFYQFADTCVQMILLETLTVVLSVLLISYFSYKNYQPFKQMKGALVKIGMHNSQDSGDKEIPEFIQSVELLFIQNQQLSHEVESERLLTRELYLSKLLEDRYYDVDSIRRSMAEYGITFSSEEYAVCILKCNKELDRKEYFTISQSARISNLQILFCYDINNRIIVIVGGKKLTHKVLEDASKHLVVHLNRHSVLAEAYINPVYSEISKTNQAYVKAISMLDYKEISNGTRHVYSALPLEERQTYYPQEELNKLFTAVLNKDVKSIDLLFQTIERQVANEVCDFSFAKTIAYALTNTIIKSVNPDDFGLVRRIRHYLWRLEHINCKLDTIALIGEMRLDMTDGQSQEKGMEDVESRLSLILQYMNDQYDNPDFYIGTISEKYGISANNLSQQFKRRFGISPAKYLNSMRIEKAKKLLQESNLSVQEIARQSGFSELSSFTRNFKAVVSISPTQYRRTVQNN